MTEARGPRGTANAPPRESRPLFVGARCPVLTDEWLEAVRLALTAGVKWLLVLVLVVVLCSPAEEPGGGRKPLLAPLPAATKSGGAGTVLLVSPSRPLRSFPVCVLLALEAVRGKPAGAEATEEVVAFMSTPSPAKLPSLRIVEAKEACREEARERATTEARWLSMTSRRCAMCRLALSHDVWGRVRYSR